MNTGTPKEPGIANVYCSSFFTTPWRTCGVRLTESLNNEDLTDSSFSFEAFKNLSFHSAKVTQRWCCPWRKFSPCSSGPEDASLHLVTCCACPRAAVSWVLMVGTCVPDGLHLEPTPVSRGDTHPGVTSVAGLCKCACRRGCRPCERPRWLLQHGAVMGQEEPPLLGFIAEVQRGCAEMQLFSPENHTRTPFPPPTSTILFNCSCEVMLSVILKSLPHPSCPTAMCWPYQASGISAALK